MVDTIAEPKIFQANQVRELQRLLGKKTMEAEILKDALKVGANQ